MQSESEVLDGVGLLRIQGAGVGIFDLTPTPKVQFSYFSTCFACLFLPAAQASISWACWSWNFGKVLPMLLGYFLVRFCYFVKKSIFSPSKPEWEVGSSDGSGEVFFFFYEWEHRTGTMCPFSSLHSLRKGKEV